MLNSCGRVKSMMKTTVIALSALSICGVASAQMGEQGSPVNLSGVSVRLGVAFPIDNTLSSVTKSFTNLGVEFQAGSALSKNGEAYVAIDYMFSSFAKKGSIIPITFNQRFYGKGVGARKSYAFAGLGVAFIDAGSASETAAVLRGGLGMNLSETTFVEAAGTFSNKTDAGAVNTIGIYFGYRF
jgi:hypothetical protein